MNGGVGGLRPITISGSERAMVAAAPCPLHRGTTSILAARIGNSHGFGCAAGDRTAKTYRSLRRLTALRSNSRRRGAGLSWGGAGREITARDPLCPRLDISAPSG